jgi:vibriolysin
VHFGSGYNNAFWYNNQMTYGDGNGSSFSPLVALDIAGHEMTHGVTEYSANLTYANESGALNESMSDVFGAMVESYARGGVVDGDTWKIGEQCYTPSTAGDALRYMDNPHLAGNGGYTSDDDPIITPSATRERLIRAAFTLIPASATKRFIWLSRAERIIEAA